MVAKHCNALQEALNQLVDDYVRHLINSAQPNMHSLVPLYLSLLAKHHRRAMAVDYLLGLAGTADLDECQAAYSQLAQQFASVAIDRSQHDLEVLPDETLAEVDRIVTEVGGR